jgi:hypothetical protein
MDWTSQSMLDVTCSPCYSKAAEDKYARPCHYQKISYLVSKCLAHLYSCQDKPAIWNILPKELQPSLKNLGKMKD